MDSERHQSQHEREQDIISTLPVDVLSHIMSRLDVKEAVKTSALSTRWRRMWTLIYNLHFNWAFNDPEAETNRETPFVDFVNHVLDHCLSRNIQNFHVKADHFLRINDAISVSNWISFAVERNVHTLILNFKFPMVRSALRLPQSILTCRSLVKLSLASWDFCLNIPESAVCFPSLKILSIFVNYPNGNLLQTLFRKCPVLEELTIDACRRRGGVVLTIGITVPTLKKLELNLPTYLNNTVAHRFVVTAPNLESLRIFGDLLACFVVGQTPSIKKVILDGDVDLSLLYGASDSEDQATNRATDFLKSVSRTVFLSLPICIMSILSTAMYGGLPMFPNLIYLELGIETFVGWSLLPVFLYHSPNLEVLVLNKDYIDYEDDLVDFEFESVPPCLLSKLKKIYFISVDSTDFEDLEIIEYLLGNSGVLEKFAARISGEDEEEDEEIRNEIITYPRASPICEIEFDASICKDELWANSVL